VVGVLLCVCVCVVEIGLFVVWWWWWGGVVGISRSLGFVFTRWG